MYTPGPEQVHSATSDQHDQSGLKLLKCTDTTLRLSNFNTTGCPCKQPDIFKQRRLVTRSVIYAMLAFEAKISQLEHMHD